MPGDAGEPVGHGYTHTVVRAMLDAVVVVGLDGCISMANDATYRLLGYDRDDLVGQPVAMLFSDQESMLRTTRVQFARPNLEVRKEEAVFIHRTGEVIPVSVMISAMLDTLGELTGLVLVARDLRETRRLLEELRQAKQHVESQLDHTRKQLHQAERLATLGTLAGGVGHELKNILSILRFCIDELAEPIEVGAIPAQLARDLSTVDEHITNHAQRLMRLARPGPDYVEPMDLTSVVEATVTMLQGAGKTKRFSVEVEASDAPLVVRVNRMRIEQIVVNLISNAADALEAADRVEDDYGMRIGLRVAPPPRHIRVRLARRKDRAECRVEDNGCGIPEDRLGHIFESFYTTKPADRGTGLGLSVVKQIVESYGGTVAVTSAPGRGTTVTFDLPLHHD